MPEFSAAIERIRNPFAGLGDSGVIAAYSARAFGNMSVHYGPTVGALDNRRDFLRGAGIDYRGIVCAKQVHGNNVRYAGDNDAGSGAIAYDSAIEGTDGFITDRIRLPLAIFTADCLSLFLFDPKTPAVGLLHAGWRSTKDNIACAGVAAMRDKFGTDPSGLYAAFGPSIRSCCYEVSAEFAGYFSSGVEKRDARFYLDLADVNKRQLLEAGLKDRNIFDSGACTSCGDKFFSYRKEGKDCGRMISVIMLK